MFAIFAVVTALSAIFAVVTLLSAIFAVVTALSAIFPVVIELLTIFDVVTAPSAIFAVVIPPSFILKALLLISTVDPSVFIDNVVPPPPNIAPVELTMLELKSVAVILPAAIDEVNNVNVSLSYTHSTASPLDQEAVVRLAPFISFITIAVLPDIESLLSPLIGAESAINFIVSPELNSLKNSSLETLNVLTLPTSE